LLKASGEEALKILKTEIEELKRKIEELASKTTGLERVVDNILDAMLELHRVEERLGKLGVLVANLKKTGHLEMHTRECCR
jgi:prefoldin subunit 5